MHVPPGPTSKGPTMFRRRPSLSQQPPASHVVIAVARGGAGGNAGAGGALTLRGTSITGGATEIGG